MYKWLILASAALACVAPANAAVLTLQSVTANGPSDFTFTYQGTLGPDEGVRTGDNLIILDFSGYIDGSVTAPGSDVVATTELTSNTGVANPIYTDDPTIANLVFTYQGPDFRNEGGPFASLSFDGLSARSTLGGTRADGFFSLTTKNSPGQSENTPIYTLGAVAVPGGTGVVPGGPDAIPEPATWAMMLGGFGMLGASMRRRSRQRSVLA